MREKVCQKNVGRPRGDGKPSKNAEAVRRCREKQKGELFTLQIKITRLEEENAALTAQNRTLLLKDREIAALTVQNRTLLLKAQQQGEKIEEMKRRFPEFANEVRVDPRNIQGNLAETLQTGDQQPVFNRRCYGDYPRPSNVEFDQRYVALPSQAFADHGNYPEYSVL